MTTHKNPKPITRKRAKARGRKHFFTGKPCIRGHIAKRFVSTKNCIECHALLQSTSAYGEYRRKLIINEASRERRAAARARAAARDAAMLGLALAEAPAPEPVTS
jgi:hypothetical protein